MQSCDISPPPSITLNPQLSVTPVQCQSKMQGCEDMRFKQRAVIEFLTTEKIPPIDIHRHMQAVYVDKCVHVSTDIGYSSFSKKK